MSDLLLVGSDHIFRQALAIVVGHQLPDCRISGQASTCAQALELLGQELPVDLALVDLDGHVGDAVELVRQIVEQRPGAAVLALTATPELTFQLRVAGAAQVVVKNASLDAILEGVHRLRSSDAA